MRKIFFCKITSNQRLRGCNKHLVFSTKSCISGEMSSRDTSVILEIGQNSLNFSFNESGVSISQSNTPNKEAFLTPSRMVSAFKLYLSLHRSRDFSMCCRSRSFFHSIPLAFPLFPNVIPQAAKVLSSFFCVLSATQLTPQVQP